MTAASETLQKTPLHGLHVRLGGRMVAFAGFDLPVQFPTGIMAEHRHTRASASLFDVSHMGQIKLSGAGAGPALEALVPGDIASLAPGQMRYSLFTNDAGGVLDDLMITRLEGGDLFLVVNGACKQADLAHLRRQVGAKAGIDYLKDRALLALQGPAAAGVLARFAPAAVKLQFMQAGQIRIAGISALISRSGYTGEDGFEISLPAEQADELARCLLAEAEVRPAGLGARDSLRLEAGLCLYGQDLDPAISPVEAGLAWTVAKRRRESGWFPGFARIARELAEGPARKRVGILLEGRLPARGHAPIFAGENAGRIGEVTSGGFSPTLDAPIAMGYVPPAYAKPGTELLLEVRGKKLPSRVVGMPFVPHRYVKS